MQRGRLSQKGPSGLGALSPRGRPLDEGQLASALEPGVTPSEAIANAIEGCDGVG